MKALFFLIEIFRKYPRLILPNIIATVAMSLLAVLSFCCLTPIIDMFLHVNGNGLSPLTLKVISVFKTVGIPANLFAVTSVFIILVILTAVLQIFGNMLVLRTKYDLFKDLMLNVFRDFFNAKWFFFSSSEQGKMYSTLNRELAVVGDGFIAIGTVFSNLVQMIMLLVVPFYISWKMTFLCLGFGGLFSLFFIFLSRSAYSLGQRNTDTGNEVNSLIYGNISGAKLVLGYGKSAQTVEKIGKAYDAHMDCTIRSQLLSYSIATAYRPIGVVVVLIVLLTSHSFGVPVSEVTILLLALLQVIILFGSIVAQKTLISNIVPGYEQIQALCKQARNMKQVSGETVFKALQREIVLEDVSFSYPGRGEILQGINMRIPKGKTIAFVGRSGAGKSTLIDILIGFHEPTGGRALIDGVPLAQYNINTYRNLLGYVPQDNVMFNMTIKDNLLWSRPEAGHDEVVEACRLAYAAEFIDQLPQGYDTVVGDRGVRLSGGQIQRVALARAFLRKPEILFLDEATSNLDSHSEALIQKAIDAIAERTTVVIVAHRLATIKRADTIYVLDKGVMVESGNYKDLCGQGGYFSDMANFQELGIHE